MSQSRPIRGHVRLVSVLSCVAGFAAVSCAYGASEIADAASEGDLAAVRTLIVEGRDVDAAQPDGTTALMWAAYHSDAELVKALLEAGAVVDATNEYGVTPLLQASRIGATPVISALLDGGADPELAHPDGVTPLMAAAGAGRVDAVNLLVERGANPNAADEFQHQTALMWAAAEGHLEVVEALLEHGADPDLRARVSALTERQNADYPSGGFTALMWAARRGDLPMVTKFAEAGADLNLTNGDGATAMMIAIVNDRFDLAAALVDLGADVDDGSLYHAVEMRDATTDWYARDGSKLRENHANDHTALSLIALFLERGADPNKVFVGQMHSASMCCDSYANGTPFYRAAVAADVEALSLLIEHGADLAWVPENVSGGARAANANVGKPVLLAAMNGGKGVPLSAGPGYSREGPPPFREPSNRDPVEAMRVLIAAGADPDAATAEGEPVLHEAVRAGKVDAIRALAEGGATLDLENKGGLTPLFLAENPLPEEDSGPFGPRRDQGAPPEEVAALLRELMQATDGATARAEPNEGGR